MSYRINISFYNIFQKKQYYIDNVELGYVKSQSYDWKGQDDESDNKKYESSNLEIPSG